MVINQYYPGFNLICKCKRCVLYQVLHESLRQALHVNRSPFTLYQLQLLAAETATVHFDFNLFW